jgi:hypothetical protein
MSMEKEGATVPIVNEKSLPCKLRRSTKGGHGDLESWAKLRKFWWFWCWSVLVQSSHRRSESWSQERSSGTHTERSRDSFVIVVITGLVLQNIAPGDLIEHPHDSVVTVLRERQQSTAPEEER